MKIPSVSINFLELQHYCRSLNDMPTHEYIADCLRAYYLDEIDAHQLAVYLDLPVSVVTETLAASSVSAADFYK